MSALAKVFVVFVFVLSVAFFGTSATLFKIRLDWKKAYESVKDESAKEFELLRTRIGDLAKEVDEKTRTIDTKDSALLKIGAEMKTMSSSLAEEKNKVEIARSQMDAAQKTSEGLAKTVEAVSQEKQALAQQLETVRGELTAAQDLARTATEERQHVVIDLNTVQIELHDARKALQTATDENAGYAMLLQAYREKYGELADLGPRIDALIKNVDNEQGLVVLSVGEEDKVQVGREFTIYRGDSFVAMVKVIRLFPNLSGARVTWLKDGDQIRIGDKATAGMGMN